MTLHQQAPDNLTLEEVKQHLYIDYSDDDTYLQSLIDLSLSYTQQETGNSILETEYVSTPEEVQNNIYVVDYYPTKVEVTLNDDSIVTLLRDELLTYNVIDTTIVQNHQIMFSLSGLFDVGYFDPEDIKQVNAFSGVNSSLLIPVTHARKLLIGDWYNHREDSSYFSQNYINYGVERLLSPVKGIFL